MDIGKRIRDLRNAKEMSQEELGEKIGVQKAAIHKYETWINISRKYDVAFLLHFGVSKYKNI